MRTDLGLNSFQTSGNSPGFSSTARCRVGILGFGAIGSAVAARLVGPDRFPTLALSHICDRRAREKRSRQPEATTANNIVWTERFDDLLTSDVDVIVEAVGGTEPAVDYVRAALLTGKSVVTVNKQVIAHHGVALLTLAERQGRQLRYGAAIGAAMPIVQLLGDGLAGDRITSFEAILSGTCNAILSTIEASGCSLDVAIAEACAKGYAEADPATELDGVDAAARLSVLCALAYHLQVRPAQIETRSAGTVKHEDFRRAFERGGTVRQVAHATFDSERNVLTTWVAPVFVPASSLFTRTSGAQTAAIVKTAYGGPVTLTGAGAGSDAIAAAVISDLALIARDRAAIVPAPVLREPAGIQGLRNLKLAEAV